MGIVWTLIVGLVVGALAKFLMPGKDGGGIVKTMLLGVAGSVVAWLLGTALGWYDNGDGPGILASTVGALLILIAYRIFRKKTPA
jgi:uncharacterized membrane protein YeaQ/YmgE (transglycosylase-associated protein family)